MKTSLKIRDGRKPKEKHRKRLRRIRRQLQPKLRPRSQGREDTGRRTQSPRGQTTGMRIPVSMYLNGIIQKRDKDLLWLWQGRVDGRDRGRK